MNKRSSPISIVLPMAGLSDEFSRAGSTYPKPLIEVYGKPLIQHVLDNLVSINLEKRFIFIVNDEDCRRFHIDNTLRLLVPNATIVNLKKPTRGALCSVLMAIDEIDSDAELLILNSDQVFNLDHAEMIVHFRNNRADSGLVCVDSVHPRWSYVQTEKEQVVRTAEKNPISRRAIAGYYYFGSAGMFFDAAFKTVLYQDHLEDIFYVSPVINQYVLANRKNLFVDVPNSKYHSFYSPQKLKEFEEFLSR